MLSYLSSGGQQDHIIDETTRGKNLGPGKTLCGRDVLGGSVEESDRFPSCKFCAKVLRRLRRQAEARVEPLPKAPMAQVDAGDLLCPVCGETMRLGVRRHSFPANHTVRVTMTLICANTSSHGESV